MAEVKSFPNNQDVYVGAEWVMKWLHGRTSGVFGSENNLAVTAVADSMSVQVSDGTGWMSNDNADGIVFWNDNEKSNGEKLTLTHDVADGNLSRIDRVVVTWETTNYVALPTISILKGALSSTPVAPALTNNSTQRQISLARVRIPAGTLSLSPNLITDERLDSSVCGIVSESIEVDTSMADAQFNDLLERIENNLEQVLSGQIANGAITTEKIADKAVTREKLSNDVKGLFVRNLLDNSDFTNSVNQRGQTNFTGNGYVIDRWFLWSDNESANFNNFDGYVGLNPYSSNDASLSQRFPKGFFTAESYTLAYCDSNDNIIIDNNPIITSNVAFDYVHIRFTEWVGVKWVALYEGEYTTETLPKYQPKEDVVELMTCLVYFHLYATEAARPSNGLDCSPPMRIPSITQGTIEIDGTTYYYNSADL